MIEIPWIVEAAGGTARGRCAGLDEARGVSIDTRTLEAGDVFFAIRGLRFDGHDFIPEAIKKGACAVVAERGALCEPPEGVCLIEVQDTVRALGDLGAYLRKRYRTPLAAVTGSTGKTTTKEMIAAILSRDRSILKTEGNRNNILGLPLTLSGLRGWQSAAVVELGISEPGEMERLVEIAAPDVALVTNIRRAHIGNFSGVEAIAEEKGLLYQKAGPRCIKVVNIDDPLVVKAAGLEAAARQDMEYVTFSTERMADVRLVDRRSTGRLGGAVITLDVRGQIFDLELGVPGMFNVENALAAIAAVLPFGVYLEDIREGLGGFRGLGGRMEVTRLGWITLLDDTYNANPDSLGAALRTLGEARGRKVAVIGEMFELGDEAAAAHAEAGREAAELGIDVIVAVGGRAGDVVRGALLGGAESSAVFAFDEKVDALCALGGSILKDGDVVLVKGSRAAGLELITEGLKTRGDASREACG